MNMLSKFPKYYELKNYVVNKKLYTDFIDKYPLYKNLSYSDYKKVIDAYTDLLIETVIENRDGVSLPSGLGSIFIGACEKPDKVVKKDRIVYNNLDTEGKLMKIFYSAFMSKIPICNYYLWSFKVCQKWTRIASKRFKTDYKKYIEVEKHIKLNSIYRNKDNSTRQVSEFYREIDI